MPRRSYFEWGGSCKDREKRSVGSSEEGRINDLTATVTTMSTRRSEVGGGDCY